ncbi:DNA-directed RNA polymerase subunit beta' [Candidatus Nasuia deltocephalinicola]|uniref:DNA-directed RNA polymerase subunit n=1 Tax=Candidatus Nasuia deltocephalincola TaxID=1160784 RepID=A0A974WKG5_9PROT|nr:DNA-directed RNA polymerase subunit beta' [Candidatus Nasuia deltocephalinicola]
MINKIKGIKINLFSQKQINNISYGRVINSKTLNYKTNKPEPRGLFCDKIFGSSNDKCYCGRTYNYDDFNLICNYCGVETSTKYDNFRRNRFGFYKLEDFFINSLYYKSSPYYLSIILNISKKDIKNILYNNYYIILFTSIKIFKVNQVINFSEYFYFKKKFYNKFYGMSGIKAIIYLLNTIDLKKEIRLIFNYLKLNNNIFDLKYKKKIKRYEVLLNIFNSKNLLNNILIKNLLILPPDLRPLVKLPDDTLVSSDINELYKRIINSNIRLKKIKNYLGCPQHIIYGEHKNIQQHIDNLFLGGGKSINDDLLKSLSENLKGKKGFFRKNLLGKRVDYSGRAVIVSGANLKFGECAIPKKIALELFRPFIYNKILNNKNFNIKMAKYEVDKMSNLALFYLSKIINNFYVLLNRAPTLHRLGIQSFKMLLTDENVIKLHPLVCASFNADFDGDQMAIHIPITSKSRIEYRKLFFTGNNILYPSNGTCCIGPTKDIILGIYYFTHLFNTKSKLIYNNFNEILFSYYNGYINLNTTIYLRVKEFLNFNLIYKIYKTNFIRVFISNFFSNSLPYSYLNKVLRKEDVSKILDILIFKHNFNYISLISDNLMKLGFNLVTQSGISISIDDMIYDFKKKNILKEINNIITSYELDYLNFFLTKSSKKSKILNLWDKTCSIISNFIIKDLSFSNYLDLNFIFIKGSSFNSLYMMMNSGARGSDNQIKQICSNRGLVNYKDHGILDTPVLSSLREGLNIFEYFYFSHNSRKTLADTALKTSSAGYLTRKLVESSNNIFISEYDCKTQDGFLLKPLVHQGDLIEDFYDRILGRVILDDFFFEKIFIKKNTLINNDLVLIFKKLNIFSLKVRSPLKCISKKGMCALCYGLDLSKGKFVNIGEMVGIVAAQSIGEPGTQLTMRTFHSGGAINKFISKSFFKSNSKGFLKYPSSIKYVLNNDNFKILISKYNKFKIVDCNNVVLEYFNVPYSSYIFFDNNSYINKNDIICKWDSEYSLVVSEFNGFIKFNNFLENLNFIFRSDLNCYEILKYRIIPYIEIFDDSNNLLFKYELTFKNLVMYKDNDFINIGDIIIKTPLEFLLEENIVGGLPKIDNFFEARKPKNKALISPFTGILKFSFFKKKKYINILNEKGSVIFSIICNPLKILNVYDGQKVFAGDYIWDGDINPHDLLFIYGFDFLINYFLEEIKYIYFSQGVKISDKHIEIILNQMLKYCVITFSGKSKFLIGDIVLISKVQSYNINLNSFDKIKYNIVLLGITNKSLKNISFISSASFQKTNYILSRSAINSSYDDMKSLKSIVMTGNIFNAGSGYYNKILTY